MAPPDAAVIRAKSLGHRFADGAWAFRGLNFSVSPGEITVLAGRNGAGKTFLAKHLAGLLEPTEGSVLVEGRAMKDIEGSRACLVGYVFQDARLQTVGETVLDDALFGPTNLGQAPADCLSRARSALLACGLADREESFVHRLSGGELRRLAIAGVLAMRPKAIILDEPFVNLDMGGVKAVSTICLEIAREGLAVLIVTHEIEKALGLANSFAVMDSGRIVLSGEPSAVLAAGVESYGLRDPFRSPQRVEDLSWLD